MNIGFDLDKILINHPPFVPSWIISKLYGEKVNGHLSYRIPGKFEQFIRNLSHTPFLRQPISKNIEILQKNKEKKNMHFFLISSRFDFLKEKTDAVIKKNNLQNIFNEMHFNYKNQQPHRFKDEIIMKKNIERYVDDDLPLLYFLAPRHPKTIFFWLNTNRNDKLKKNVYAITDLSSVFEHI